MTKKLQNTIVVGGLIALASILLTIESAAAQSKVCSKRDDIVARLESGYKEFSTAMGMSTNGELVELFVSEKGTWTLILSNPNGTSCLIAAGENWVPMQPLKSKGPAY
jgi:hypothetical protein